jgi:cytidylate kinase
VIVTIDGPAGAGKSSVAKRLAEFVGFNHLDSGAFYRCYAWLANNDSVSLDSKEDVQAMLDSSELKADFNQNPPQYWINGINVTDHIRTNAVSSIVSEIAKIGIVRTCIVKQLRAVAEHGNFVIEGRDIGTVVFPHAGVKFYLTASIEERARRRYKELQAKGENVDLKSLELQIQNRDYEDSHREIAPLTRPENSIEIDCTNLSIDEVIAAMAEQIPESEAKGAKTC